MLAVLIRAKDNNAVDITEIGCAFSSNSAANLYKGHMVPGAEMVRGIMLQETC